MAIIGLSGYAGSGKDTVAQIIQELQPDKNWQIKKFSGKLKQMASLLTNVPVEKFEDQDYKHNGEVMIYAFQDPNNWFDGYRQSKVRQFLQFLGTECGRDLLGENVWVDALLKDYDDDNDNWIITDVRFPNEADAVGLLGHVVKVVRGSAVNDHPSETALDNFILDYRLDNMGDLVDLRNEVEYMLKHL